MRLMRGLVLVGALGLLLAGCGGNGDESSSDLTEEAEAACTGSELSEAPKLPAGWPDMGEVTFTEQSTQGPTEVVEGYFEGDIQAAGPPLYRSLR